MCLLIVPCDWNVIGRVHVSHVDYVVECVVIECVGAGSTVLVRNRMHCVRLDNHNQYAIHSSNQIIDIHTLSIIWFIFWSPFCSSFPLCTVRHFGEECPVHICNPTLYMALVWIRVSRRLHYADVCHAR